MDITPNQLFVAGISIIALAAIVTAIAFRNINKEMQMGESDE